MEITQKYTHTITCILNIVHQLQTQSQMEESESVKAEMQDNLRTR